MTDNNPVTFPVSGRVPQDTMDWIQQQATKKGITVSKEVSELLQESNQRHHFNKKVELPENLAPCMDESCGWHRGDYNKYPSGCLLFSSDTINQFGLDLCCPYFPARKRDDG